MTLGSRLSAALVVALVCLPALGSAPSAGAKARPKVTVRDGVTQAVFSYKDAIRETVYVQSTVDGDLDGDLDLIATDIIRPKETEKGLKVPVIYEMSPYYQTLGRGNESETKEPEDGDFRPEVFPLFYDNYFVPRGYAVINQDMRGTRNSEGCMVLGDQEELIDAKATIDWLNGRGKAFTGDGKPVKADWTTGQVGMIGKSYDGSVANGAASLGIKGLETIVPIGAISRWYDYHLNNGAQYLNAYVTPALFTFVIDQPLADDEERGAEWVEATFGEYGPCSAKGAVIVARAADPRADHDDFWDGRDYLKDVKNVKASVFVVHGLNDWNVKPNHYVQWWDALAKRDVPRKIWLGATGHVDAFDFRRGEWVRTLHRWFDFWLHDIDNGIMDEPMADVERRPGVWETYRDWPDPAARDVALYLGGESTNEGTLSLRPPKEGQLRFVDDPLQSEQQMVDPQRTSGARLLLRSAKLKKDVRISGAMAVELVASVDRVDTNFAAKLVDYGDGNKVLTVSESTVNMQSESCWGESTKKDDACYKDTSVPSSTSDYHVVSRGWLDARHHESLRRNSPLIPGQTYKFRWEIFGDDYVFEKGHRIGLVVAGSDRSWTIPDPNRATITVMLGKSRLLLPVVGGSRALHF